MSLISMEFLTFVAVAVIGYYLIPKRYQWVWLLAFSYIYYASSGMKYLVFLLYTTVVTYGIARMIYGADQKFAKQKEKIKTYKKSIMVLALLLDFGMLAVLKYTNFAISNVNTLFHADIRMVKFLLPLGISFYTFQSVGYILDVYWKRYEPEKNIFKFALFVSFFPQILQGPIARFDQLKKQLCSGHTFSYATFVGGFELMIWGYFQKLVIADRAAVFVDRLFGEYRSYTGVYMLLAGVLYSIQLYTDFNGCVCIARGASEMLGITLAENFDHPYFATSIQDFWHRWHMSLSSWLRDYVYIPLGGNRKGKLRKYVNILLTFLVSGLWHGMGLTYLVWGFLHGLYQITGSLLMPVRDRLVSLTKTDRSCFSHRLLKQLCTFFLVMLAWIFFRADSVTQALQMIRQMAVFNPWVLWNQSVYLLGLDAKNVWILFFAIDILLLVSILQTKTDIRGWLAKQGIVFRYAVVYLALFAVLIFGIYGPGYDAVQFIYGGF